MRSCVLAAALGLSASASACGGETTASNQPSSPDLDADESAALYELNRLREGEGIPGALAGCRSLSKAASAHSDDMRDTGYVAEKGTDGSTPRQRACDAGYAPGCDTVATHAELVASGYDTGEKVAAFWAEDPGRKAALLDASMIVAGIGRSVNAKDESWWTLDLGSVNDASCAE